MYVCVFVLCDALKEILEYISEKNGLLMIQSAKGHKDSFSVQNDQSICHMTE